MAVGGSRWGGGRGSSSGRENCINTSSIMGGGVGWMMWWGVGGRKGLEWRDLFDFGWL